MPELWELRLGAVFLVEGKLRARLSGWRAESGERRAESGERRAESGLTCGARFGLSRSGRDGSHIMKSKRGILGGSVGCGKVFSAAVYGSWGEREWGQVFHVAGFQKFDPRVNGVGCFRWQDSPPSTGPGEQDARRLPDSFRLRSSQGCRLTRSWHWAKPGAGV